MLTAVVKRTRCPFWQAARARAEARWLLPTPVRAEEDDVGFLAMNSRSKRERIWARLMRLGWEKLNASSVFRTGMRASLRRRDEALEARVGLGGDEAIKDLEVGDLLLRRRLEDLRVDLEDPRQVEGEEVPLEAFFGLGRHRWLRFPGRGRRARGRSPRQDDALEVGGAREREGPRGGGFVRRRCSTRMRST